MAVTAKASSKGAVASAAMAVGGHSSFVMVVVGLGCAYMYL